MNWRPPAALGLTVLGLASAAGAGAREVSLLPHFQAGVPRPVLTATLTTGTVAPQYYHEAELVIRGDGSWQALRRYPYTQPPSTTPIASGTLPLTRVQALVELAFTGSPRFIDLPSEYPEALTRRPIGGGHRVLTLNVDGGTHSVTVYGVPPASFMKLTEAIAAETVPLGLQ